MTGMPAGESVRIRDDEGEVLLTYRSFTSVVAIVAAFVAIIVVAAGGAAAVFLAVEKHPITAIVAFVLALFFSLAITILVPPVSVTLFNDSSPALTILQTSRFSFPAVTHAVATPDGRTLALIRRSIFSRLGRNRWAILRVSDRHVIGYAVEESFSRALARKAAGKFNRRFDANVRIRYRGHDVGLIMRRPQPDGSVDILDVSRDTANMFDKRIAVALATLVLGSEP